MRHIKDIHQLVSDVRQCLIKTMQERGMKELFLVRDIREFASDNDLDDDDPDLEDKYREYLSDNAPSVDFIGKHGRCISYTVTKVERVTGTAPHFLFYCVPDESDVPEETIDEYSFGRNSLFEVYECMERELGIDDEPETVWLVRRESNDDGEIHFCTEVCRDEKTACRIMKEWRDSILTEHPKFKDAKPYVDGEKDLSDDDCCYEIEQHGRGFYVNALYDDYYENIVIEPKEMR